ncbi:fimbrial protein [Pseudomonas sp. NPDC087612]|uniref:fimbrial protein n=1 Tax=Pseudomonas sp. NPDC087612 TaxID=3364441 RepID=UPI003830EB0E
MTAWGVKNSVGSDSPITTTFPIGDTGLGWQWIYQKKGPLQGYGGAKSLPAGSYTYTGSENAIRIIKIGQIKSNAKIPAGVIGHIKTADLYGISLRIANEVTFVSQSCESPDVKVDMGDHDVSTFLREGSHSRPTSFSIKLLNCPTGINKVQYQLITTSGSPALSSSTGVVALNKSSTAKGIALQLMDDTQQPIEFGKNYVFHDYSSTGGSFNIPLTARYLRILPSGDASQHDPGMAAGTANAEVTFVMSYL